MPTIVGILTFMGRKIKIYGQETIVGILIVGILTFMGMKIKIYGQETIVGILTFMGRKKCMLS